jgi:hypothetical protein
MTQKSKDVDASSNPVDAATSLEALFATLTATGSSTSPLPGPHDFYSLTNQIYQ